MAQRTVTSIFAPLAALACLFAADLAAGAEPAVQATAKQIAADAAAIAGAWDNFARQLPDLARCRQLPAPEAVAITLPKALRRSDLRLQLLVWNNRYLCGRAWVANFDAIARPVWVLSESTGVDGTTLRLAMPVTDSLAEGPAREIQLLIDLTLSGPAAKLKGSFAIATPDYAAKGELAGSRQALAGAALAPPALRASDPAALDARQLFTGSLDLMRLYRAADLVLTQAAAPADAWAAGRVVAPDLLPEPAAKSTPGKKTPKLPTLTSDDDMDLGERHNAPPPTPPKPAADPAVQPRYPAIAALMGRMCASAAAWAAAIPTLRSAAPGAEEAAADPEFGPWYGHGCLASDTTHANLLPDDVEAAGNQRWLHVRNWQSIGPFTPVPPRLVSWNLPEFFDAADANYAVDLDALKRDGETCVTTRQVAWQRAEDQIEEGMQRPWTTRGTGKMPTEKYDGPSTGITYARAEVHSPKDADLWVGISASDFGRVWVNGRPAAAAVGDPNTPGSVDRIGWGKASFRKGANTLVVRLDAYTKVFGSGANRKVERRAVPNFFWVKVAVRGKPLDAAAARARASAVAARQGQLQHLPPNIQAYRNNNVAHYPLVKPVTAWDIDSNTNVLWRVHMEFESAGGYGSSAASSKAPPVVMGDKIIVLREPHFIRCLDKMTGKVLWDRECNVLEFTAPDKLEECRRLWDAYEQTRTKLLKLGRRNADREAALVKRGMTAEEAKAEIRRLAGEVGEKAGGKKGGGSGFFDFLVEHGKMGLPCYGAWTGYSYASPVTDGRRIWVKFATGVAACFDPDGKRIWMTQIPAEGGNSVCPSPMLIDGKFIVEVGAKADRPGLDRFTWDWTRLIALDADTGKELWRSEPLFHATATSSPVAMKLTNGREEMSVVVTDGAAIVRAEDGKVLSQTWLVDAGQGSPTVAGPVVYHPSEAALLTASRPVMYDRDSVGLQRLWSQMLPTGFDAGMAFAGGLLYGSGGGQGPGGYLIFDPRRRAVLRHENPGHGESSTVWRGVPPQSNGRQYVPITVAGEYVFIGDHGSVFHGPVEKGGAICGVVQRNPRGLLVGKSLVEKSWTGPPVFDGDRVYIRTDPSLICVGYTGDAGRAYEADINAQYMLGDLETQPPTDTPPIDIAPVGPGAPPPGTPFNGFISFPIEVFGYFSIARADEVLAALGGLAPTTERGKAPVASVEVGGETITRVSYGNCGIYGRAALLDKMHFRDVEYGKGAYFRAMLANDRPRVVRVWAPQEPPDVWINGQKVPEGTRVRLKPGTYSLTARAFHTKEWPAAQGFYFRLDDSSDVAAEHIAWQEMLRTSRPELERIAKYASRPAHVARAKKLLEAMERKVP